MLPDFHPYHSDMDFNFRLSSTQNFNTTEQTRQNDAQANVTRSHGAHESSQRRASVPRAPTINKQLIHRNLPWFNSHSQRGNHLLMNVGIYLQYVFHFLPYFLLCLKRVMEMYSTFITRPYAIK